MRKLKDIIIAVAIIAGIMLGGYASRGYFALGAEVMAAPMLIGVIGCKWAKEKEEEK